MKYYLFIGMTSHEVSESMAMYLASLGCVILDSNCRHVIA
jgi:hypothetical protein